MLHCAAKWPGSGWKKPNPAKRFMLNDFLADVAGLRKINFVTHWQIDF